MKREAEIEFQLHGAAFTSMTVSRVAEYMKELGALAGPNAVFVRMTKTKIVFKEVPNEKEQINPGSDPACPRTRPR